MELQQGAESWSKSVAVLLVELQQVLLVELQQGAESWSKSVAVLLVELQQGVLLVQLQRGAESLSKSVAVLLVELQQGVLLVQLQQGAESLSKSVAVLLVGLHQGVLLVQLQQGAESWAKSGAVLLVESMFATFRKGLLSQRAEGLGCTMVEWVGSVECHQADCLEEWGWAGMKLRAHQVDSQGWWVQVMCMLWAEVWPGVAGLGWPFYPRNPDCCQVWRTCDGVSLHSPNIPWSPTDPVSKFSDASGLVGLGLLGVPEPTLGKTHQLSGVRGEQDLLQQSCMVAVTIQHTYTKGHPVASLLKTICT